MKISELQKTRNIQQVQSPSGLQNKLNNKGLKVIGGQSFYSILDNELKPENSITFSAHAQKRISGRNIQVDINRLQDGIAKVEKKGSTSSLFLIDKEAYIVSVKNKTVVTAVGQESLKNNVFTNIDSVAIV